MRKITFILAFVMSFFALQNADAQAQKLEAYSVDFSAPAYWDPNSPASNAVDGNLDTYYWSSRALTAGDTFKLEIENVAEIHDIKLYFADGDRTTAADIEISENGTEWTKVDGFTNGTELSSFTCNANGAHAKYVRMKIVTPNGDLWFKLSEFEVYGNEIEGEEGEGELQAYYTVVAEGHNSNTSPAWAVNNEGTNFVSTGNTTIANEAQKNFAFVEHNGNTYIYSVHAKKFVMKDASLQATAEPDAVTVEELSNGKYFFKFDDSHIINIGGSKQMVIDTWSTKDGGNQYTLIEGGNFDITEAISILENSYTITYNFIYNGNKVDEQVSKITRGANYPAFKALPFGVTSTTPEGVPTDNEIMDIEVSVSLPFEYADSYENITAWYKLGIRDDNQGPSYLKYDPSKQYIPTPGTYDENAKGNFAWAFVGDPFAGFSIVNYAAGETMVLSAPSAPTGNQNAAELARMVVKEGAAGNTAWILKATTHNNAKTGAFYIEHPTATSYAFNRQSYNSENSLCYYDGRDTGSALWTELLPMTDTPTAYTFSQVTAAELMAKTEPTYIAIKNLSRTNNRWFVGNTGSTPYSKEEFTNDAVFVWEPVTEGEAGSYRLKKLNGDYMQTSAPKDFGTVDAAAVFTATAPGTEGGTFSGDPDSNPYISDGNDANLVRFVKGTNWINVQNGDSGTPTYNTGLGGWTIHYVYEIAEVEEFTVNISDAQFSTFYAQKNVVLPDNATAYIIDGIKDNNWLNLVEVTGVLPANTGIILYSETPVECKLTVTNDAATAVVTDNKLSGAINDSYVVKDESSSYYILSKKDNVVAMYNPVLGEDTNKFKTYANKAYLVLAGSQPSTSLRFDFGGTTGIDEITENGVQSTVIYDLQGRRVSEITEKGIYIVGGKKVLVK